MSWSEAIIAVHTSVTDQVSHAARLKSERYFVWQEDGGNDDGSENRHSERAVTADDTHTEKAVTGTTDLFTKQEFDPWKEELEAAFDASPYIAWELNSVQYEEETGLTHHEWVWEVYDDGDVQDAGA